MLYQALGADIGGVILAGAGDFIAPSQRLDRSLVLEELDCLINRIYTFFGSQGHLSWPL